MAKEALTGSTLAGKNLMRALRESQAKFVIAAGAGANTNIPIAGIATEDTLEFVLEIPASAAVVDRTSVASITSAGNIQLTQSTSGNQLLVIWADKN